MKILIDSLLLGISFIIVFYLFIQSKSLYFIWKKKRIKKRDKNLRDYLKNFQEGEKLAIIDETPREVFIGDRFYLLKPLKYRQYTRLCILFAHTLQNLQTKGINYEQADKFIGDVTENAEDDFFRAVAIVLYFSNNENETNEKKIFEGMQKEYEYIKKHGTIDQISRVIEIVMIQNDVERALKAFGLVGKKKAVLFNG